MSENCDNNCGNCGEDCADRKEEKHDFRETLNELSHVKKVIGIVSGKGGVGKSSVSAMLAVTMQRLGYRVGVLDADVTGPSIPKAFGIRGKAEGSDLGLYPRQSKTGIAIMSVNLLLDNDTDPVIWRGPILGNTVKQFWTDVIWGDLDFLFIDMPPGTGDVPLDGFPVHPRGRHCYRNLAAGAGVHDRLQSAENGGDDENSRAGAGRKHVLFPVPG